MTVLYPHKLELCEYGVRCRTCGAQWRRIPKSPCPQMPLYHGSLTKDLATRAQLQAMGLTKGAAKPSACAQDGGQQRWLYEIKKATAREPFDQYAELPSYHPNGWSTKPPAPAVAWAYHQAAAQWARSLVSAPLEWLILDVQTTGICSDAEVIEIAVVTPDGGTLLNTFIKPSRPIPPSAIRIHNITNEMVANAPEANSLLTPLEEILFGMLVVAYGADFDRAKTNNMFRQAGVTPPQRIEWQCAMVWHARFYAEWSEFHSDYLWQPLLGGVHRARENCLATLRLIQGMADESLPVHPSMIEPFAKEKENALTANSSDSPGSGLWEHQDRNLGW